MENFLYKCEFCTLAKFSVVDKGEVWFIDCMACRNMQFHHKVTIHIIGLRDERAELICEMDDKEEEDGKSEKR
jgi:hypothetical protein